MLSVRTRRMLVAAGLGGVAAFLVVVTFVAFHWVLILLTVMVLMVFGRVFCLLADDDHLDKLVSQRVPTPDRQPAPRVPLMRLPYRSTEDDLGEPQITGEELDRAMEEALRQTPDLAISVVALRPDRTDEQEK